MTIDDILNLDESIRYVAIYQDGELQTKAKDGRQGASAAESDRYEEIIVNPTLLTLTQQRGNIDCGGMEYVVIRYGNFFQLVMPNARGHVSVCVESDADVIKIAQRLRTRPRFSKPT